LDPTETPRVNPLDPMETPRVNPLDPMDMPRLNPLDPMDMPRSQPHGPVHRLADHDNRVRWADPDRRGGTGRQAHRQRNNQKQSIHSIT